MEAETHGEGDAEVGADESLEKDGIAPLSLDEIKACNVAELAKDKIKSRQLQRSLARGGSEFSEVIFTKVEPHMMELVRDQHGNYLLQKLFEVISAEQFDKVFSLLKHHLISLAKDTHGTRAVQKIVEISVARNLIDEMLEALPGEQVEELARNLTGFHVIIKLLDTLPTAKANELIERLCFSTVGSHMSSEKVQVMGKDQWGCCVLKKCFDRSEGEMRDRLVEAIREHTLELVQDAYGNYVVQHLIINRPTATAGGRLAPVTLIIDAMKGSMLDLSLQKFSSNVLEKCLQNSSDKDRNKIINEILNPPNQRPSEAVRLLLFHQFGNYVFQQALEVAKDPQFSLLIEHSKPHIQGIIRQTYADVPGNLSVEHTHRLAMKLAKKYPQLSEGLDMGLDASWMPFGYDPMSYGYGFGFDGGFGGDFSGFGFDPYQFDPFSAGFGSFPPGMAMPMMGQGCGGKGSQGRKKTDGKSGQKGKQAGGQKGGDHSSGKGAPVGNQSGSQEAKKVGRVVGFWPNYTITYDEVPAAAGGRGKSKNKAKSKATPKPKA